MGLVNEQHLREKLQNSIFKILLVVIVLTAIILLIRNDGFFN